MHRISRPDLAAAINVIITCSRLKRHRSGRQINASLETAEGKAALTQLICDAIDNDSRMVIATEMVGFPGRPGMWSVDEPDPTQSLTAE